MKNLIEALIKFQTEVKPIPKDSDNPFFKSKYAELSTIVGVCQPVLNHNGLCISQVMRVSDIDRNVLITKLMHTSGEIDESLIMIPETTDVQKLTAAITYLRRTQYISILGLVADVDDDGNSVGEQQKQTPSQKYPAGKPITEQQSKALWAISKAKNIPVPDIKTFEDAKAWITKMNEKK